MRIFIASVIGIVSASAGFGAGFVGGMVVAPWTGKPHWALAIGIASGVTAALAVVLIVFRSLGKLRYAFLLSH